MQNEILKTQKIGLKLSQVGTLSRMFAIQTFAAKGFIITPEQFTVLSVLIENDRALSKADICNYLERPPKHYTYSQYS